MRRFADWGDGFLMRIFFFIQQKKMFVLFSLADERRKTSRKYASTSLTGYVSLMAGGDEKK